MKAYKITDRNGVYDYAIIVFAENRNKAKAIAVNTDSFEDIEYKDIRAIRMPKLDKYYRGESEMDWYNAEDRIAMVKEAGFSCSLDYWEEEDCLECPAWQWCDRCEVEE